MRGLEAGPARGGKRPGPLQCAGPRAVKITGGAAAYGRAAGQRPGAAEKLERILHAAHAAAGIARPCRRLRFSKNGFPPCGPELYGVYCQASRAGSIRQKEELK